MYIINFKTIHDKLIASGNTVHSICNYKLMTLFSKLPLPKEQKQAKTANSRKKLFEKIVEGISKKIFHWKLFYFQLFFKSIGILFLSM